MKKFILITAVLGIFAIYSFGIRHQVPVLKKPSSLSTNNSTSKSSGASASNSGSSSSSGSSSGSNTNTSSNTSNSTSQYADGTYTGSLADAYYGNVQVEVTISGGKITDVKFLQYPDTHSTSVIINQQAMPYLQQEAIKSQNSNVQLISGATFTSQAFIQSLKAALSKA